MSGSFRLASFNLENLDDEPGLVPPLAARIEALRPELIRLEADILCLQEVNGQKPAGTGPRRLAALDALLAGTQYAAFERAATHGPRGTPLDKQNLVILARWPLGAVRQLKHELVPAPAVALMTARPRPPGPLPIEWDRPLLYAAVTLPGGAKLHLINLHLRAPLAAFVAGQKEGEFAWASAGGWAEGFYLAAIKRSGQALEARLLIEQLQAAEPEALIAVAGDFNAEASEMPTRILKADIDDTGNGRLLPHSLVAVEALVPPERRFSVLHGGRKLLLDHLLASRPLARRLLGAAIHNEALPDELVGIAAAGVAGSFHAPVVAEFRL